MEKSDEVETPSETSGRRLLFDVQGNVTAERADSVLTSVGKDPSS